MITVRAHRELETGKLIAVEVIGHSDDVRVCAAASMLSTLTRYVGSSEQIGDGKVRCVVDQTRSAQLMAELIVKGFLDMCESGLVDVDVTWNLSKAA